MRRQTGTEGQCFALCYRPEYIPRGPARCPEGGRPRSSRSEGRDVSDPGVAGLTPARQPFRRIAHAGFRPAIAELQKPVAARSVEIDARRRRDPRLRAPRCRAIAVPTDAALVEALAPVIAGRLDRAAKRVSIQAAPTRSEAKPRPRARESRPGRQTTRGPPSRRAGDQQFLR